MQDRVDLSFVPQSIMEAIEKSANLPEEVKERERPYWKEMREALTRCPEGDTYTFLGGILLGSLYRNTADPFAAVYQAIAVPQDDARQGIDKKLRHIGKIFFPLIGRDDLVTKYALGD